jgi:hypothetical protein
MRKKKKEKVKRERERENQNLEMERTWAIHQPRHLRELTAHS